MAPHATLSVGATLAFARVSTLVADTGQVAGAVGTDDALRPTVGRTAPVALEARAGSAAVVLAALGIRAARAWRAWTGDRIGD